MYVLRITPNERKKNAIRNICVYHYFTLCLLDYYHFFFSGASFLMDFAKLTLPRVVAKAMIRENVTFFVMTRLICVRQE